MKTKLQARLIAVAIFLTFVIIGAVLTVAQGGEGMDQKWMGISALITMVIYYSFLKPKED